MDNKIIKKAQEMERYASVNKLLKLDNLQLVNILKKKNKIDEYEIMQYMMSKSNLVRLILDRC